MGHSSYSKKPKTDKFACARGNDLSVHFKNTREVAHTIKGWNLKKAIKYLKQVQKKERIVPFTRFNGGVGRHAQCKEFKITTQGRWPVKSAKFMLQLLENVTANATEKSLDIDSLVISHIQVNAAAKRQRRTFRAHGRINAFMSSPCHIEVMVEEPFQNVERPKEPNK